MKRGFCTIQFILFFLINQSFGSSKCFTIADTAQLETTKVLQKMQPSMKGKTLKGNTYSMFSIKAKKDWVFLVMDSLEVYSMKFDEVNDQLAESDKSVTEILCLAAKSNSLKKKEKARVVAGTELECFYKMQGKAAKMYKSAKKMNAKAKTIVSRTRKEYRSAKKGVSKVKGAKGKLKKAKASKGKSLL